MWYLFFYEKQKTKKKKKREIEKECTSKVILTIHTEFNRIKNFSYIL